MESNLLYSKFTDLNVNFIQNTFTDTCSIKFDQLSEQCGLVKLIYKISHHYTSLPTALCALLEWWFLLTIPSWLPELSLETCSRVFYCRHIYFTDTSNSTWPRHPTWFPLTSSPTLNLFWYSRSQLMLPHSRIQLVMQASSLRGCSTLLSPLMLVPPTKENVPLTAVLA